MFLIYNHHIHFNNNSIINNNSEVIKKEENVLDNKRDCNGNTYLSLKQKYIKDGYVIFRSCTITQVLLNGTYDFVSEIKTDRVCDGYLTNDYVRDLALDADTLVLIEYLHDRKAFPFQTLNFPVGTQQPIHSDLIHFDTLPIRGLMTASWVALENVHPNSGPLVYYPGSHKNHIWDYDELGLRAHWGDLMHDGNAILQNEYSTKLQEALTKVGLKPHFAVMNRGESFLWAASLVHGGSKVKDKAYTRKLQVTHLMVHNPIGLH